MNTGVPLKTYGRSKPLLILITILSIIAFIVGIAINEYIVIIGSLMFLVFCFLNLRLKIVAIYDQYSKITLAPAQKTITIYNADIISVIQNKKYLTICSKSGSKTIESNVLLSAFSKEDGQEVIDYYTKLVNI